MTSDTLHVTIAPPPLPGYDVVVRAGLFDELSPLLAAAAPAARYAVIAPHDVAELYGTRVTAALADAGLRADLLTFPAGEASKTRATWSALTDRMLALRIGRDGCVIALGGGVAGDLAGFVAATYMRGLPFVQLPTTLLAMVDASVGGKVGVDTGAGKNLVGAFHPPSLVLADPLVLRTLPPHEFRAGLAEAVKHGAILDAAYFEWIEAHATAVLALDPDRLATLIARSVALKADVVMRDPYENGARAALNFGHTVAHALERQAGYAMLHGYAVARGMVIEALAGEASGITETGTADRIVALLDRFALPVRGRVDDVSDLLDSMRLDKKARAARARFALPARIGELARPRDGGWTWPLDDAALERAFTMVSSEQHDV